MNEIQKIDINALGTMMCLGTNGTKKKAFVSDLACVELAKKVNEIIEMLNKK